jgi:hypothetical protein
MDQFQKRQTPEALMERNDSGSPAGESRRRLLGTDKDHDCGLL